ncbi:MAG: M28 family peptidase, partial [Proteobacteria bacterium]|nr:M28 family peptidase [Pseudomonadota bacterium]
MKQEEEKRQVVPVECPSPDDLGIFPGGRSVSTESLALIAPGSTGAAIPAANSERTPPFEAGSKLLPHLRKAGRAGSSSRPALRQEQLRLGERQVVELARKMSLPGAEFEGWPTRNALGVDSWTWARYRNAPTESWQWLIVPDEVVSGSMLDIEADDTAPLLPIVRNAAGVPSDYEEIFRDFLDFRFLTMKPIFGDMIWTDTLGGSTVYSSWLNPDLRPVYEQCAPEATRSFGIELPQPSRVNDKAVTFIASIQSKSIIWSPEIDVAPSMPVSITPKAAKIQIKDWLPNFFEIYHDAIGVISGAQVAKFPISGSEMYFTRKNNAQIDHHLEYLNDYLQERYKELGIETRRLPFEWRRMTHSNLVAVIPGEMQGRDPNPVLMMDHIDTAFAHDVFYSSGVRVSVPGADDNATAVAALMLAAEQLRGRKLKHDIWLVHLTGEEFPADDLGARHFVQTLDLNRIEPSAMIQLDMIGYSKTSATEFQINPGDSPGSLELARLTLGAAADVAPGMHGLYRPYATPESYLYNTDGIIFSDYGLPVILINEVVNRTNYHLR